MQSQKLCTMFQQYCCKIKNMQKVLSANSHLSISKGTRKVTRARKYRRPEDLEDPNYYGLGPKPEVKSAFDSLAARGFTKEQLPYKPPADVEEKLKIICKKVFGHELNSSWKEQQLTDPLMKFKLLTKCMETLKKNIPNSNIHTMKTVNDVLAFYEIPIDGCHHYDTLLRDSKKLPPNLHLIREAPVFNPATDTFFDGITAFPGRRRLIYTKYGEKFEKIIQWPNV